MLRVTVEARRLLRLQRSLQLAFHSQQARWSHTAGPRSRSGLGVNPPKANYVDMFSVPL